MLGCTNLILIVKCNWEPAGSSRHHCRWATAAVAWWVVTHWPVARPPVSGVLHQPCHYTIHHTPYTAIHCHTLPYTTIHCQLPYISLTVLTIWTPFDLNSQEPGKYLTFLCHVTDDPPCWAAHLILFCKLSRVNSSDLEMKFWINTQSS